MTHIMYDTTVSTKNKTKTLGNVSFFYSVVFHSVKVVGEFLLTDEDL